MSKKGNFREWFYEKIAPVITGLGASVVIIGALFKIEHFPGASELLIIGLGTEAVLFAMFAFAPVHKDPDWTRVYPQLADDFADEEEPESKLGLVDKVGSMLEKAKIDQALVEKLGRGMSNLADTANKVTDLTQASVATKEYATNVKAASTAMAELNKSYASTIGSMSAMASTAADAQKYHGEVQKATKNLTSLNAVYELELQDGKKHIEAMNKFYSNLAGALTSMTDAGKEAGAFKTQMSTLTGNLTSLNNVYGNMLAAMKGTPVVK